MQTPILIKDPYLHSQKKEIDPRSSSHLYQPNHNISMQSQPIHNQFIRNRAVSSVEVNDLKGRVKVYEKELRNMEEAYSRQQQAARKLLNYNQVNREYHQAMRARNFQLNTKLREAVSQMQMVHHRSSEDQLRYGHDKDMIVKKYQEQTEEYLRLRANYNSLLQQKTRLQQQLSHISFLLQKQAHQHELQMKQQIFRTDSMDRTYKALVSAKDQQIGQLIQRLRNYEDQNRKLVDINRTLQLTKDRGDKLDNLSQINQQSNMKSRTYQKDKENQDHLNLPKSHFKENQQLKQQKTINEQLRKQLQNLKQQIKNINLKNSRLQNQLKEGQNGRLNNNQSLLESSKWQGLISSIATLRQGLNKQIFQVFFKSVKDGQKKKQNSLVIFIQNWKSLNMQRLQPYIRSYFEARNNLKQVAQTKKAKESIHYHKMEQVIPIHVGTRPGRSNINQWILSTIQFTKNQKDNGKKSLNNYLLFLFRLLTIEYRIKYPMQGKSYNLDNDVVNQLMHEIIKGIQFIYKYQ